MEGINWKSRLMRSLQDYYPHPTDPFCSGFTNCPSKCYGDNGCDCDVPDGRDGDPHCLLCESPKYGGLGCTECDIENGYFKVDYNYPCKQCEEVFGEGCLHCGDFNGCEECDLQYYDRIFDPDCEVYYCRKKTCGSLPLYQHHKIHYVCENSKSFVFWFFCFFLPLFDRETFFVFYPFFVSWRVISLHLFYF